AHWLKETRKVDMYPARMTILEADQKGEIDDAYVEQFFQQWLNDTALKIPRENAAQYGRNALKLETLETPTDIKSQLEALVSDLNEQVKFESENTVPLKST
ncbi:DUF2309 domain-containing protein, partial [Staphylococcus saprophyticus]|nr:DUF2309 domain-containing protein [Staphylococcus saprophyticus]